MLLRLKESYAMHPGVRFFATLMKRLCLGPRFHFSGKKPIISSPYVRKDVLDSVQTLELSIPERRQDSRQEQKDITVRVASTFKALYSIDCSRGGARVVLSSPVETGQTFAVTVETCGSIRCYNARVAWIRQVTPEYTIAGLAFH